MSFVLYENGIELGEVGDWGFMPGKIQYQDVNGERVPVGKDSDKCQFIAPKMLATIGKEYFVVFEGKTKFNIQIIRVTNNQVLAYVLGKEAFTP